MHVRTADHTQDPAAAPGEKAARFARSFVARMGDDLVA
jgi:hypothetical protein